MRGLDRRSQRWLFLPALLAVLLLMAGSYFLELKGPAIDAVVSEIASSKTGLPIRILDARVRHWLDIRFQMMMLDSGGGKELLVSGKGHIRFQRAALLKGDANRVLVTLNDFMILEPFYRKSSLVAWTVKRVFSGPILIDRLELVLLERGDKTRIHFVKFRSKELVLIGGLELQGRSVAKANITALLPDGEFEGIPKEVRRRMLHRADGWRGVRLVYYHQDLTVLGMGGPFFKAKWR